MDHNCQCILIQFTNQDVADVAEMIRYKKKSRLQHRPLDISWIFGNRSESDGKKEHLRDCQVISTTNLLSTKSFKKDMYSNSGNVWVSICTDTRSAGSGIHKSFLPVLISFKMLLVLFMRLNFEECTGESFEIYRPSEIV